MRATAAPPTPASPPSPAPSTTTAPASAASPAPSPPSATSQGRPRGRSTEAVAEAVVRRRWWSARRVWSSVAFRSCRSSRRRRSRAICGPRTRVSTTPALISALVRALIRPLVSPTHTPHRSSHADWTAEKTDALSFLATNRHSSLSRYLPFQSFLYYLFPTAFYLRTYDTTYISH